MPQFTKAYEDILSKGESSEKREGRYVHKDLVMKVAAKKMQVSKRTMERRYKHVEQYFDEILNDAKKFIRPKEN